MPHCETYRQGRGVYQNQGTYEYANIKLDYSSFVQKSHRVALILLYFELW